MRKIDQKNSLLWKEWQKVFVFVHSGAGVCVIIFPEKNKKEQKKVYGKGEIWKWLKEK